MQERSQDGVDADERHRRSSRRTHRYAQLQTSRQCASARFVLEKRHLTHSPNTRPHLHPTLEVLPRQVHQRPARALSSQFAATRSRSAFISRVKIRVNCHSLFTSFTLDIASAHLNHNNGAHNALIIVHTKTLKRCIHRTTCDRPHICSLALRRDHLHMNTRAPPVAN